MCMHLRIMFSAQLCCNDGSTVSVIVPLVQFSQTCARRGNHKTIIIPNFIKASSSATSIFGLQIASVANVRRPQCHIRFGGTYAPIKKRNCWLHQLFLWTRHPRHVRKQVWAECMNSLFYSLASNRVRRSISTSDNEQSTPTACNVRFSYAIVRFQTTLVELHWWWPKVSWLSSSHSSPSS